MTLAESRGSAGSVLPSAAARALTVKSADSLSRVRPMATLLICAV
jgi:hypothetical protein